MLTYYLLVSIYYYISACYYRRRRMFTTLNYYLPSTTYYPQLPSTEVIYVGMTVGISNVISIVMDEINLTLTLFCQF